MPPSAELEALELELKTHLASPNAETLAFLNDAMERVRVLPFKTDPSRRCACLLDIASLFYHQGESTLGGIEPAALAVMMARGLGDAALLRKALTIQAVILFSTGNAGDAITTLAEALEIAEAINDELGKVGVWINLGAAFYEAALYADARDCAERAICLATGSIALRQWKAVSLANVALYCVHMQEYEAGLNSIRDAIDVGHTPRTPAELLNRVFAEGTYTRLLLALGRVAEASKRAQIAKALALQAKSVRADISAACAEGLVEVYSGFTDVGLSRAMAALEKARAVRPSLRETLLALVQACERAGKPERALELHAELTLDIRKAQQGSMVRHQELHLQQLHAAQQTAVGITRLKIVQALAKPVNKTLC